LIDGIRNQKNSEDVIINDDEGDTSRDVGGK
jgi:hypothetical protein